MSAEFWEDHFRCKYPNSSRTPYNAHYTTECTTREKLTRETLAFEKQLQFVSDAVMAFSKALDYMHQELCGDKVGMCDAMRPTKGAELLKYLRKVSFQGEFGLIIYLTLPISTFPLSLHRLIHN